jgi:hypothetical protein
VKGARAASPLNASDIERAYEELQDLVRSGEWEGRPKASIRLLLEAFDDLVAQINDLANFILANVPGEPSESSGACDTAQRIIGDLLQAAAWERKQRGQS